MSNHGMPRAKRWGQVSLVAAVVFNATAVLLDLRVSTLEGELASKREQEKYFIDNDRRISSEVSEFTILQASLSQLQMLHRMVGPSLSRTDDSVFKQNVRVLQQHINGSHRQIVTATFLQGHDDDIPIDTDMDEYFAGVSNDSLIVLFPLYQADAAEFAIGLKDGMIRLIDTVSWWRGAHSFTLALGTFILVIGTVLILLAREPRTG